MYRQTFNALFVINIVMQSIFTLLFDIGLFVLIGWLLTAKANVGEWVFVPLILVGVGVGVFSMFKLILVSMRNLEALEKNQTAPEKSTKKEDTDNG